MLNGPSRSQSGHNESNCQYMVPIVKHEMQLPLKKPFVTSHNICGLWQWELISKTIFNSCLNCSRKEMSYSNVLLKRHQLNLETLAPIVILQITGE